MRSSVLNKIEEIAAALLTALRYQEIGLYSGNAGLSLFLFYYARFKGERAVHQKASEMVDDLFAQTEATTQFSFSLCSGIAGVGWLVDHACKQSFLEASPDEILSDIDEYVYQVALSNLSRGHYDFLHGAMGMMLYLVKRNRKDYLRYLVRALDSVAIWEGSCAKWRSVIRQEEGIMGFSIALSHGSSAIALVLCKILQIMQGDEAAKRLLKGTVEYILNQEIPVDQYGCYFPSFSIESQPELFTSRLGWCYGDIGVGLAIWQSGISLKNQAWMNKGMEVLLHTASRRGLAENKIQDAGICHGAAGVAHIFNRLYRNTGRIEFKEAADYWCAEALTMGKLEDGLAGYKAWRTKQYGGPQPNITFLEGIAGIGLCLLSFVMPEDPAWDECLLLS